MALRPARIVVLATTSAVLGALAHALGSGSTPTELVVATPPSALAAAGALTVAAIGVLGWRRRPGWLVALVLTLVQTVQHLALLTAGAGAVTLPAAAHHHHGAAVAVGGVSASAGGHLGPHAGHDPVLMALAHLLAAILTAVLLGYGEHVVGLLMAWLRWLAPILGPVPIAQVGAPRRRWVPARPLPPSAVLTGGVGLRGPPAPSAAL